MSSELQYGTSAGALPPRQRKAAAAGGAASADAPSPAAGWGAQAGLRACFLGSAQSDRQVEPRAMDGGEYLPAPVRRCEFELVVRHGPTLPET